jgi:hypothetical protein
LKAMGDSDARNLGLDNADLENKDWHVLGRQLLQKRIFPLTHNPT